MMMIGPLHLRKGRHVATWHKSPRITCIHQEPHVKEPVLSCPVYGQVDVVSERSRNRQLAEELANIKVLVAAAETEACTAREENLVLSSEADKVRFLLLSPSCCRKTRRWHCEGGVSAGCCKRACSANRPLFGHGTACPPRCLKRCLHAVPAPAAAVPAVDP